MFPLPYRTGATWLSDDELVLLDAMFRNGAARWHLSRENYLIQFNFGYTYSLGDDALDEALWRLTSRRVLKPEPSVPLVYYRMTPHGGDLWSLERCPVWERFVTGRHTETRPGRGWQAVVAGSAKVRDHFLTLWSDCPVRTRTATLADIPIAGWRSFPVGHYGAVVYEEPRDLPPEQFMAWLHSHRRHEERVERERSWWWDVRDLQKFVPMAAAPVAPSHGRQ
jgi:hypothetical protein